MHTDYRMSSDTAYTSIVVLNWNNYHDSYHCLQSLTDSSETNIDIILVDNDSEDRSGERLDQEFPDVEVIYADENLGWAGGNNLGIRRALTRGAEYVWILNNDTIIPNSDVVETLVTTLESNPDLGMVSPLVKNYPETETIWFLDGYMDWKRADAGHDITGSDYPDDKVLRTDFVPMCSVMIPAGVIEEVGLLPEEYFAYYEDMDYCARLTAAGYSLATTTRAEIYHKGSASSGGFESPIYTYYFSRNRWIFFRKFRDRVSRFFYISYVGYLLRYTRRFIARTDSRNLKALLQGAVHGITGKTGKGPYP